MIEINLLPVREARRKADLRQQGMHLVLGLRRWPRRDSASRTRVW